MITKDELKEYAKIRKLNLGQAEKDYFQNVLLFVLYQNYGRGLIFKGGTALSKCFGLGRFSEDLDFTCEESFDIKKIEDSFKRFRVEFETETKNYKDGLKIIFRIKGPLYIGIRHSMCNFIIDLSFRENVILKPEIKTIGRFLEEIPAFDVFVMQEKEIMAEKVRAVMTRKKARDVYDIWFLINNGVGFDLEFINKKLGYYGQKWDFKMFKNKLEEKKTIWNTELNSLVSNTPDFELVKSNILKFIKI